MIDVSIIIPNWNGGKVLEECLTSILQHTVLPTFELIVIDNGSTDDGPDVIRRLASDDSHIRTIFNEENLLFARACNQGYEISRGRDILVANNDIILVDDAVCALVNHLRRYPNAGAVTPVFRDREGTAIEFFRRLPSAPRIITHYHKLGRGFDKVFLRRSIQNAYLCRDLSFDTTVIVEQPGASFTLFRREMLDLLGGLFDERFPLLFNDVDLATRMHRSGYLSHVLADVSVVHLDSVSSTKFDPQAFENLRFNGIFEYFRKHHPMQMALLALVWPVRYLRWRRSPSRAPNA
jgi:GT2 family glycosyltransferase